jgi:acyl-CoA thioesterase-1
MAKKTMRKLTGLALAAFAAGISCAFATDPAPPVTASPPVDPTAIIEIDPPSPTWPKIPQELSLLSSQCSVPEGELATMVPGFNRTIEKLGTTKALRILAIGSSSTWGVGASTMKRNYPSRLEAILSQVWKGVEIEIVNRGVGGEVASQTAWRMLDEINLVQPDLVLWQVGTNDALTNVPLDAFEKTVRTTIAELRQRNIDVVLVGLQYTPKYARHEHYFRIRKVLDEVAASEKLLYVRRYRAMEYIANTKANLQMMAGDNFHLNDLGYQCMAEHVAQAVVANLFVRRRDKGPTLAGGEARVR